MYLLLRNAFFFSLFCDATLDSKVSYINHLYRCWVSVFANFGFPRLLVLSDLPLPPLCFPGEPLFPDLLFPCPAASLGPPTRSTNCDHSSWSICCTASRRDSASASALFCHSNRFLFSRASSLSSRSTSLAFASVLKKYMHVIV